MPSMDLSDQKVRFVGALLSRISKFILDLCKTHNTVNLSSNNLFSNCYFGLNNSKYFFDQSQYFSKIKKIGFDILIRLN